MEGVKLIKRSNLAWMPLPEPLPGPSWFWRDPRADLGALAESRRQEQEPVDLNAPLMDALVRSERPEQSVGIVILEYSRNDSWREALATAAELEERRQAITDAGFDLQSGAKILVPPNVFELVAKELESVRTTWASGTWWLMLSWKSRFTRP